MGLSLFGDTTERKAPGSRENAMDTSRTNSYVSLSLLEIRKRFEELQEEDLDILSLEDPETTGAQPPDGYNPYGNT